MILEGSPPKTTTTLRTVNFIPYNPHTVITGNRTDTFHLQPMVQAAT